MYKGETLERIACLFEKYSQYHITRYDTYFTIDTQDYDSVMQWMCKFYGLIQESVLIDNDVRDSFTLASWFLIHIKINKLNIAIYYE